MGMFCEECNEEHDPDHLEIAMRYPEPVLAIPEAQWPRRVIEMGDAVILDRERFFLRCVVPIPVIGEPRTYRLGFWAELEQQAFESSLGETPGPLPAALANTGLLVGNALGLPVELDFPSPDTVPTARVVDERSTLAQIQRDGWRTEDILEFVHLCTRAREDLREDPEGDPVVLHRLRQATRQAALRNFMRTAERHLGITMTHPERTFELPAHLGILMATDEMRTGEAEYFGAEKVEELVAWADARVEELGRDREWSIATLNLDEDRQTHSRTYFQDGTVKDMKPLPTRVTLACTLVLPDGKVGLVRSGDGWVPYLGVLTHPGAEQTEWIENAFQSLEGVHHLPRLKKVELEEQIGWVAWGEDALDAATEAIAICELVMEADQAGRLLAIPEARATKLFESRMFELDLLLSLAKAFGGGGIFPNEPEVATLVRRLDRVQSRSAKRLAQYVKAAQQ